MLENGVKAGMHTYRLRIQLQVSTMQIQVRNKIILAACLQISRIWRRGDNSFIQASILAFMIAENVLH
jgi:hypothetical protein